MMRLFDTAQQRVVPFPDERDITMYVCGITPYASAHLGHALTYLTFDLVARRLRDLGRRVRYVRNVTDIDDPLFARARETQVNWQTLGKAELTKFQSAMQAMKVLPPDDEVLVTTTIDRLVSRIQTAIEKNAAYVVNDHVYFSVASASQFGEISHKNRTSMLELAAQRGGNINDPHKRDPLDVVLWQPSQPDEPRWASPWGDGRPGWHIECTTIIEAFLGNTVTLHGGGADLLFPHHECESSIAWALNGAPLAHHWMHVALLSYQGNKMSKSLGNLVFVNEVIQKWQPAVLRVALLHAHYRTEWEWHDELLDVAAERIAHWRSANNTGQYDGAVLNDVRACLDDDLNAPAALDVLDKAAASGSVLRPAAKLLGVEL